MRKISRYVTILPLPTDIVPTPPQKERTQRELEREEKEKEAKERKEELEVCCGPRLRQNAILILLQREMRRKEEFEVRCGCRLSWLGAVDSIAAGKETKGTRT